MMIVGSILAKLKMRDLCTSRFGFPFEIFVAKKAKYNCNENAHYNHTKETNDKHDLPVKCENFSSSGFLIRLVVGEFFQVLLLVH